MSGFHTPRARLEYWLFAGATFAVATTHSMLALLALVLKQRHMSEEQIGIVLSSPGIPMVIAMLLAGTVVARLGALQIARAGALIILVSYVSFELTAGSFAGAMASRVAYGIGHALFMPAGLLYINEKLNARQRIYYVGIYGSMYPLPNIIAPLLAEGYLRRYGVEGLFLVTAAPSLLGAALVFALAPTRTTAVRRSRLSEYLAHLKNPGLRAPYGGILYFGLCWGFALSFMALLLESRGVPVGYFFSSFTVCVFGSRFLLVRYVQHLAPPAIFGGAMAFLASAFLLLAFAGGPAITVAAGVLFGLGHSVAYPTVGVWVAQQFEPDRQGMPLALFNAMFTIGIYLLPLLGGFVIVSLGMETLVLGLGVACIAVAVAVVAGERARLRQPAAIPRELPPEP